VLVRVMAIDCHAELQRAWQAIVEAGGPEAVPEAVAAFRRLPFAYGDAGAMAQQIRDARKRVFLTREWAAFFRAAYAEAEAAAGQRRAQSEGEGPT